MDIANLARAVSEYGRYGDSELIHVSPAELKALQSLGVMSTNPHTGLPEAFNLGNALGGLFGGGHQDMPGKDILSKGATQAGQAGTQLITDAQAGQLTPSMQAQVDQQTQAAKARSEQFFSQPGASQADSTMRLSSLQNVDQAALAQRQNFIDAMYKEGLSLLGGSSTAFGQIASYQLGQDKLAQDALGGIFGAAGKMFGKTDLTKLFSGAGEATADVFSGLGGADFMPIA